MGTEFYLMRRDNWTLFELGKGLINEAFEHLEHEPAPLDRAAVLPAIVEALRNYDHKDISEEDEYAAFVAEQVFAWAGKATIGFCSEHEIDGKWDRWQIAASRYYPEMPRIVDGEIPHDKFLPWKGGYEHEAFLLH